MLQLTERSEQALQEGLPPEGRHLRLCWVVKVQKVHSMQLQGHQTLSQAGANAGRVDAVAAHHVVCRDLSGKKLVSQRPCLLGTNDD